MLDCIGVDGSGENECLLVVMLCFSFFVSFCAKDWSIAEVDDQKEW